jgi:hypothetical protein
MAYAGLTHSNPLRDKDTIMSEPHARAFYNSNGDGSAIFQD